jgi:hypothetical protein
MDFEREATSQLRQLDAPLDTVLSGAISKNGTLSWIFFEEQIHFFDLATKQRVAIWSLPRYEQVWSSAYLFLFHD